MSDPRFFELARMPLNQRAVRIAEIFNSGTAEDDDAPSRAKRRALRAEALKESPSAFFARRIRELRHWGSPRRVGETTRIVARMIRDWAANGAFPSPGNHTPGSSGFCGRAASLAPDYLAEAYSRGLAPRNFLGVATLWSPATRAVLRPWDFPRGLTHAHTEACSISLDESFDDVLRASAGQDPDHRRDPWIDLALADLFDAGFAHSLEVRDIDGALIAGLIGVAIGGVFTIERLYARDQEALTRGVNSLAFQLQRWNFALIDMPATSELARSLRCANISRSTYGAELAGNGCGGRHGHWRISMDFRQPARSSDSFLPQKVPANQQMGHVRDAV